MGPIPWQENDELFKKFLEEGHFFAGLVADQLRAKGISCIQPRLPFRKDISENRFYAENDQDLLVTTKRRVVEVKSRNLEFTKPEDYPFSTAFTVAVDRWKMKKVKPVAVVLISQITCAAVVVPTSSKSSWTTSRHRDRVRNAESFQYAAPKEKIKPFDEFCDWLKAAELRDWLKVDQFFGDWTWQPAGRRTLKTTGRWRTRKAEQ